MSSDRAHQPPKEGCQAQPRNPFGGAAAFRNSNYCYFDGTRLVRQAVEAQACPRSIESVFEPSSLTAFVHDGFRALTLNEHFPCVGAKAAVRQGDYRFGLYDALASPTSCEGLAHDLFRFIHDLDRLESEFSTFVASFSGPLPPDEPTFERLLWKTLQRLNELDAVHHHWDRKVAADPADPHFSFSFGERAFFLVGLHAASSRATRRFAWPTLIFNPHDQFDRLKASGRYERFKTVIRGADKALQGDVNPMMADFGVRSEAVQYSGRQVAGDWRCPFHAGLIGVDQQDKGTSPERHAGDYGETVADGRRVAVPSLCPQDGRDLRARPSESC